MNGHWTEDLPRQAARGLELGRAFCSCDAHYHAFWGIIRAAGFVGSLAAEERVLHGVLESLFTEGTRVLIAGAADTGSLCAVGRAAGALSTDITVLDRCAAPLKLIEAFAAEHAISCKTLHTDLLDLEAEGEWDVALVHYTFSFVAPDRRLEAMSRLSRALAPGGTLVCTAKTGKPLSASPEVLEHLWMENARRKINAAGLDLRLEPNELDMLLRQGAAARTVRRQIIPTVDELKARFKDAGLNLTGEHETPREWALQLDGARRAADVEKSVIMTAMRS